MSPKEFSPKAAERMYLIACAWFTGGVYLDGWAHNHIPQLETFFTPWHGVFYSGYFAAALILILWTRNGRRSGKSWKDAIPPGHALSLLGAGFFFLGGIGDLIWHRIFGIEGNLEALLSPTHLVLAASMTLIVSGGMRHFWATRAPSSGRSFAESLPLLLSILFTLGVILFMSQFGHYTDMRVTGAPPPTADLREFFQIASIQGILFFSAALIGVLSLALRRERLPVGSVTLILTLQVAALAFMRTGREIIPSALAAGILGDALLRWIYARGKDRSPGWMRAFGFLLPFLFYAFAFETLRATQGVWMTVHMWTGSIVLAGIAGLLAATVAWPPRTEISTAASMRGEQR